MQKFFFSFVFLLVTIFSAAQMQLKITVYNSYTYKPINNAVINNGSNTKFTGANGTATISKFKVRNIQITAPYFTTLNITNAVFADSNYITVLLKPINHAETPIEVIAIKANNSTPFAFTNISNSFITKHNTAADIPFMLTQTPGVIAHSDAGNGLGYTGMRIRGSDATRINITLNGVPFNDAESQGSFFVNLPDFLSSAESIQVQRGVGGSTNGGGAFGASVHINTFALNAKPSVQFNNSFGSFNTSKHTLKVNSGKVAEHFYFDARLSYLKSNGYIDRATSNLQGYFISGSYIKNKTSVTINAFSGNEKTYQAWYGVPQNLLTTNPTYNEAGTEKPGLPYQNQIDNYNQNNYQAIFRHKFNTNLSGHITLFNVVGGGYYEQYKAKVNYSDINLIAPLGFTKTDVIRQLWLRNNFYGTNYSLQYNKEKLNVLFGGNISAYNGAHFGYIIWAQHGAIPNNYKFYNHTATKKELNNYLKATYKLTNNIDAYTDFQLRQVQYTISGFRNSPMVNVNKKYSFFNPKAGLQYTNKTTKLFASIAIANKEPNRDDFETGINQIPKPEQLTDVEIGYQTTLKNKLKLAATFYIMHYKNQLVLTGAVNDVGAQTRTNVLNSSRTGVELEADYTLSNTFSIKTNAAFSNNNIKNFTEAIVNYDNNTTVINNYKNTPIALSPNSIINIIPTLAVSSKVFIAWQNQIVSKQFLDNTGNNTRQLNGYYNSNLLLSYTKVISKANANFFVQVNNIFNKIYTPNGYTYNFIAGGALSVNNYYYPMAGTNILIGVNVSF